MRANEWKVNDLVREAKKDKLRGKLEKINDDNPFEFTSQNKHQEFKT
jgi:hypothetical protein